MNIFNSKDKKKIKELEEKLKEQKKQKSKGNMGRYDSGNTIKKAKKANNYLSQLVLFVAQINMFLLAYGYHSSAGFFNLCWLIFSLIMPTTSTLFLSIVVMIPILSWEFIFIYCGSVPKISKTTFFENYGKYFRFNMVNETIE